MDDTSAVIDIQFTRAHSEAEIGRLCEKLEEVDGIHSLDADKYGLSATYQPYKISPAFIRQVLDELNIQEQIETEKKGFVARFIDRLAASNEKNYGNKRLDCCGLNDEERQGP